MLKTVSAGGVAIGVLSMCDRIDGVADGTVALRVNADLQAERMRGADQLGEL